ncbi:MAG: chemotaxis protein CheW, partial [Betaproteobacteria bacterium]|nr:chemotaxis protein CheW [Betaproteobacteria bacterium]
MNTTADIDSSVSRESAAGNFSDTAQFLTFSLGQETLGLNILTIKEIIEYGRLTAVPQMPRFIEGVINLRGRVVPVVNLALR